jgi:hypothetical protein
MAGASRRTPAICDVSVTVDKETMKLMIPQQTPETSTPTPVPAKPVVVVMPCEASQPTEWKTVNQQWVVSASCPPPVTLACFVLTSVASQQGQLMGYSKSYSQGCSERESITHSGFSCVYEVVNQSAKPNCYHEARLPGCHSRLVIVLIRVLGLRSHFACPADAGAVLR